MALPAALSSCTMCVRLSTSGTAWTDFSDDLSVVDPVELTRQNGEFYVFGEDNSGVLAGRRQPVEWRIRGIYVDGTTPASEAVQFLWAAYTATCGSTEMHIQVSPAGCVVTGQAWSTATAVADKSVLVSFTPFGGDASSGDPIMFEAVIRSQMVYKAAWAA